MLSLTSLLPAQSPIAFPGAVGHGANATGGRSGVSIYHVTNLNDSGSGSFRDAVSQSNRIVVFDVGGYIVAKSAISVASNITILGQTAPGGGIGIRARETSFSKSNNVIVRGMRFRQGGEDPATGKSAVGISNGYNMIFDHCSIEFGRWDNFDAVFDGTMLAKGLLENITLQNSIVALPTYQGFGAHIEGGPMTFYRNLWVDEHNRQPLAKNNDIYINNVIYNYDLGYTAGNTGGVFSHDIVSNYFIAGPSTTVPSDAFFQLKSNQTAYAIDNMLDSNVNGILDGSIYNTVDNATPSATPWSTLTNNIPTLSSTDAFYSVVATAGAWPRDTVDQFVANDVLSLGTLGRQYRGESSSAVANYPNSQANTGITDNGYGTLTSGTPYASASGSGIPDYWATANGIDATDAAAGAKAYGSTGYLNIEAYANSLILPDSWYALDLGAPMRQGASSYNPFTKTWLQTASGSSAFDEGQFAAQRWAEDGTLSVEVASTTGNGGIMVRSANSATAAAASITVSNSGVVSFQWRTSDGSAAKSLQSKGWSLPVYLKLVRSNGAVSGYASADGGTWKLVGSAVVSLATAAQAGIFTNSGNSTLTTSQFQNIAFGADTGSTVTLSAASTSFNYPNSTLLTVTAPDSTSTGQVQIWDNGSLLSTLALQGNGAAYWWMQPALNAGAHALLATYAGDSKHNAGVSAPLTISVAQAPTTLSASCWNSNFAYGANYSCTANISSNAGAATGSLVYALDGAMSSIALNSRSAQWSFPAPSAGNHTVSIYYLSQDNFASSNTVTEGFTVPPATVLMQLTPSSWYLASGTPLTLTARLSSWSASAPATGTVTFYDGATALGTAPVDSNSIAVFTVPSPGIGQHLFSAQYAGPANYSAATSQTVTMQVY
ncbi:MAG: Ig-like domain repeat protein [Terracidiphilus sp.]|nr:Ig-like domain repeat protein [Terracidiphilus sp.]